VGLIGGEALADKGLLSPPLAMWAANLILLAIGLVMTLRMGHESGSGRGGGMGEWLDNIRARRALRAAASRS
jgi:lipopolysaccharide export system permease protein